MRYFRKNWYHLLYRTGISLAGLWILWSILLPLESWAGGAYPYRFPGPKLSLDPKADTVIGLMGEYTVKEKDTFLDVARDYDLGFNELETLYPHIDPWVPPLGMKVVIPSQWILPQSRKYGIVINIAEMRLYYFFKNIRMVRTYPIGIGDQGWFSPEGTCWVAEKRKNPTWHIPKSLQEKYQLKTMPPGPDNPLGDYWLGLSFSGYGIHGTNFPWAVGRLVTHGCIRLYPEDIKVLFSMVPIKTPVELIYEPVKVGFKQGRIFMEVHPDIYGKIPKFTEYGIKKISSLGLAAMVNDDLMRKALEEKQGIPVDITQN
ncbi:MAG: L,D-transpeptidase family protein [Thermodesulfobacteriota bacterium]